MPFATDAEEGTREPGMATTNFVRVWKDGDRKFVNVNGTTIEVASITFDEGIVTLQFNARLAPFRDHRDSEKELAIAASGPVHRLDRVTDEAA